VIDDCIVVMILGSSDFVSPPMVLTTFLNGTPLMSSNGMSIEK
jgi:hypothetical protein